MRARKAGISVFFFSALDKSTNELSQKETGLYRIYIGTIANFFDLFDLVYTRALGFRYGDVFLRFGLSHGGEAGVW
jgi:hypothetical protein